MRAGPITGAEIRAAAQRLGGPDTGDEEVQARLSGAMDGDDPDFWDELGRMLTVFMEGEDMPMTVDVAQFGMLCALQGLALAYDVLVHRETLEVTDARA